MSLAARLRSYAVDGTLHDRMEFQALGPTVFKPHEAMTWPYDDSALRELLMGYVAPVLGLVANVDEAMRADTLVSLPHMTTAASRAWVEYTTVRRHLIQHGQSHMQLGPDQRAAFVYLWLASVRLRVHANALQGRPLDTRTSRDFTYVVQASRACRQPLHVADGQTFMCNWTLQEWSDAMLQLIDVVEEVGAAIPGLQDYWYALWRRLTELLDHVSVDGPDARIDRPAFGRPDDTEQLLDDDTDDVRETGTLASGRTLTPDELARTRRALGVMRDLGLVGEDASVQDADEALRAMRAVERATAMARERRASLLNVYAHMSTEAETRHSDSVLRLLREPMPYVHAGRRLCVTFLERMEIIYAAYEQRMRTTSLFIRASSLVSAVAWRQAVVVPVLLGHDRRGVVVDAWSSYIKGIKDQADTVRDDTIREQCVGRLPDAYLQAGEKERCIFDMVITQRSLGSDADVPRDLNAAEVLSQRADVYRKVRRYEDRQLVPYLERIDLFLRTDEAACINDKPAEVAPEGERYALVLLSLLLDTETRGKFMRACWLDELRHADGSVAIRPVEGPLFETPAQAVAVMRAAAQDLGVLVVRVLRRTFVILVRSVTEHSDLDHDRDLMADTPPQLVPGHVVEVPSILVAFIVWMAFANLPSAAMVPMPFRALTTALRERAAAL